MSAFRDFTVAINGLAVGWNLNVLASGSPSPLVTMLCILTNLVVVALFIGGSFSSHQRAEGK